MVENKKCEKGLKKDIPSSKCVSKKEYLARKRRSRTLKKMDKIMEELEKVNKKYDDILNEIEGSTSMDEIKLLKKKRTLNNKKSRNLTKRHNKLDILVADIEEEFSIPVKEPY